MAHKKEEDKWLCIFPGKGGRSWRLWKAYSKELMSQQEAQSYADKFANVVAVPLFLWEHIDSLQKQRDALKYGKRKNMYPPNLGE